jgi:hypothetical protein
VSWGAKIEHWEHVRSLGRPVPEGYDKRPTVENAFRFYEDAFWRLNNDRALGFGIGPIPFSSIDRYAQRYRIVDLDEFETFLTIIKALDSEYLRLHAPASSDGTVINEVAVNDVEGVRSLLHRLGKPPKPNGANP